MSTAIVLDSGILGMVTNPNPKGEVFECYQWFEALFGQGVQFVIPEIVDYEVRRELLRLGRKESIVRLNGLESQVGYLPVTTEAMRKAAELWASARKKGRPTAAPDALDVDVILAAQTTVFSVGKTQAVIATTNVGHLALFVEAYHWRDID